MNSGSSCPGASIPDGSLGIREHFISPYRPGEKITIDEYYRYIFDHVEGLPEVAGAEGLSTLDYMRKYGAFEVEQTAYAKHLKKLDDEAVAGAESDPETNTLVADGKTVGRDGRRGSAGRLPHTVVKAGILLPDHGGLGLAGVRHTHLHQEPRASRTNSTARNGEFPLLPTFRLPTLIHSRSGNAQVAQRDLQPKSGVDAPAGTPTGWAFARVTWSG